MATFNPYEILGQLVSGTQDNSRMKEVDPTKYPGSPSDPGKYDGSILDVAQSPNALQASMYKPVEALPDNTQYPFSPVDPIKDQQSILDIARSPSALQPSLYDYGATPDQNLANGAPMAMNLGLNAPMNMPMRPDAKAIDQVAPAPKSKPFAPTDRLSMSGDKYMEKMLKEGATKTAPPEESDQDKAMLKQSANPEPTQEEVDSELLAAQQDRRDNLQNLALLQGLKTMGRSLVKADPDDGQNLVEQYKDQAGLSLTELREKRAEQDKKSEKARQVEKDARDKEIFALDKQSKEASNKLNTMTLKNKETANDPNSAVSQTARKFAAQQYIQMNRPKDAQFVLNGNLSAQEVNDQFGSYSLSNERAAYEAQQARLQQAKLSAEEKARASKEKVDEKNKDQKDSMTQSFRKELTDGKKGELLMSYETAEASRKAFEEFRKSPSGYKDYATLMSGLKTLQGDNSVVREAEIRLGMNAASLPDKLKNYYSSLANGQSLTDGQRKEIASVVGTMADIHKKKYMNVIQPILEQAKEKGIDDKYILPSNLRNVTPEASAEYSASEEAGIAAVMKANAGATREQAIGALKKAGKIK